MAKFVSVGKKTTEEVLKELEKDPNVKILRDVSKGLYIVYNKSNMLNEIEMIKRRYNGNPNKKQEDANCTNAEAIKRLDNVRRVIEFIDGLENPDILFDCLPYTKAGKIAKNKKVTLYLPDLKSTYSGDYFSQLEFALQLEHIHIMPTGSFSFDWETVDNIYVIELNHRASFTNSKRPENIIDENGNFHKAAPAKRNTYLKQEELNVGSSYTDAKGTEYLYLGIIDGTHSYSTQRPDGSPYGHSGVSYFKYAYLRVTKGVKKELEAANSLYDYLYDRFCKKIKKNRYGWGEGLNHTESKKFTELNTVYFDGEKSELKDMQIKCPEGTFANDPHFGINFKIKFRK